jgi:hypothetical protein
MNAAGQSNRKTILKSFRIPAHLEQTLDQAAKDLKITQSQLVSETLERRLVAEPLMPGFAGVVVHDRLFQRFVDMVDKKSDPSNAGFETANQDFPLALQLLSYEISREGLMNFMNEVLARAWGWFDYPVKRSGSGELMLYHEHGKNWSEFLKSYFSQAFLIVANLRPVIVAQEKLVRLKFQE